jgi:transposase
MRVHRQTVEHPFGTLKSWMGYTHFLTKGLDRVSTEMSLHVLAYNLKRVINIMGMPALTEAIAVTQGHLLAILHPVYY